MIKYFQTLLFTVIGVATLWGQQEERVREIPTPPYIAELPKHSRYTVRIEGNAGEAQENALAAVAVTKLGAVKGVVEVFKGGKVKEFWLVGGFVLIKQQGMKRPGVFDNDGVQIDVPVTHGDFWGFDWLAADAYLRMETVDGKRCYVFGRSGSHAWIDASTKLPVRLVQGGLVYRFDYAFNLPEDSQMSPEFDQCWKEYLAAIKAVTGTSGPR